MSNSPSSPAAPVPAAAQITVAGNTYPLRWDLGAIYRLQGLPKPPDLSGDALTANRALRTMIDMIWAALSPEARFTSPEALAAALGAVVGGLAQVQEAWAAMMGEAEPSEEKKSVTKPSLSPVSS